MRHLRFVIPPILAMALVTGGAGGQGATPEGLTRARGVLTGKVTDSSGQGLAGVKVKLFEEGFLLTETTSQAGGSYSLDVDYLPDIDWTVLVWFVPEQPDLIPEILILRESLKSKDLELWSPCLPRMELRPQMSFDVTLMKENEKLSQMSELDCIKGDGQ